MANQGVVPGDIIVSQTVAPGLVFIHPTEPSTGYPLVPGTAGLGASVGPSATEIAISPDNQWLGWVSGSSGAQAVRFYQMDGSGAFIVPVSGIAGNATDIAWHPDGNRVAVSHSAAPYLTEYTWPGLTKLPEVDVIPAVACRRVRYSPDGRLLAVGHDTTSSAPGFRLYDAVNRVRLPDPPDGLSTSASALDFSPDSQKLFTLARTVGATNCRVYDTNDWSSFLIPVTVGGTSSNKKVVFNASGTRVATGGTGAAYVRVFETTNWTELGGAVLLPSAIVAGLDWIGDDVLVVNQTDISLLDYSAGAPVLLGIIKGGSASNALAVRRGGSKREFRGRVTHGEDNPLQRKVRALDRATGRFLAETESDPADGAFTLRVYSPNPAIVYAAGDGSESTQIADNYTPVAPL